MKQRKTFSAWLTSKYLLIIRDEENFAEQGTIRFNYVKVLLLFSALFVSVLILSFFLITTILSQWFDPRTDYLKTNHKIVELELKIDSFATALSVKDQYLKNIKNVLQGRASGTTDTEEKDEDGKNYTDIDLAELAPIDSQFRKEFEGYDYNKQKKRPQTSDELQQVYFFSPITGAITREFDSYDKHLGVDIVSKANEPIKCVADGSIILSSWTQDSGYIIAVQHRSNLISFYKHNSALLKTVGEIVRAGDIIAIIGNTGELTDGPHLHFELWYNGNPVDPEEFISF